jgi:hypothetical protein
MFELPWELEGDRTTRLRPESAITSAVKSSELPRTLADTGQGLPLESRKTSAVTRLGVSVTAGGRKPGSRLRLTVRVLMVAGGGSAMALSLESALSRRVLISSGVAGRSSLNDLS